MLHLKQKSEKIMQSPLSCSNAIKTLFPLIVASILAGCQTTQGSCYQTTGNETFSGQARLNSKKATLASFTKVELLEKNTHILAGQHQIKNSINSRILGICNFSRYRDRDGKVWFTSARHCMNNDLFSPKEDFQSTEEIPRTIKILSDASIILNTSSQKPVEGDTILIQGCYYDTGKCFQVTGLYSKLYQDKEDWVYGLWLTPEQFHILSKESSRLLTEGLSGSPVVSKDTKDFLGVVSSTVQVGCKIDSTNGTRGAEFYGIAIASKD